MATHKPVRRNEARIHAPLLGLGLSATLRIARLHTESKICPGTLANENSLLSYRLESFMSSVRGRIHNSFRQVLDDNRPCESAWLALARSFAVEFFFGSGCLVRLPIARFRVELSRQEREGSKQSRRDPRVVGCCAHPGWRTNVLRRHGPGCAGFTIASANLRGSWASPGIRLPCYDVTLRKARVSGNMASYTTLSNGIGTLAIAD